MQLSELMNNMHIQCQFYLDMEHEKLAPEDYEKIYDLILESVTEADNSLAKVTSDFRAMTMKYVNNPQAKEELIIRFDISARLDIVFSALQAAAPILADKLEDAGIEIQDGWGEVLLTTQSM